MSRSASSLSGKTKHKLVFLGDQGTGKSSII
jgi:GTPase SAR1 family protein